jgi:predicted NBD/HSP70 family sugar kinase
VTGSQKHRDPRFPPFAFTEHGAIMAASILSSPRAVEMSVYVVRAFVQLRELLASNTELACRLDVLERMLQGHDAAITAILSAIRELMKPQEPKRRGIGFTADVERRNRRPRSCRQAR